MPAAAITLAIAKIRNIRRSTSALREITEIQAGDPHSQDKRDAAIGKFDTMIAKLDEVIENRKQQETCNPTTKTGCSG